MTTRSQKRKAVEELFSGGLETLITENNPTENLIAAPTAKKTSNLQNVEDSHSEAENTFTAPTSTPINTETAVSNNTPLFSVTGSFLKNFKFQNNRIFLK